MLKAAEEFEIFIVTYNRAEMLRGAIESCLQQSVIDIPITILDNASTDHTANVVASFQNPNIRHLPAEQNLGFFGNIQRSQQLCSKKYVMIFHDDDQLHPQYIEKAHHYLEAHADANIAVCNFVTIPAQSKPDASAQMTRPVLKLDKTHFAAAFYSKNKIAFCSAVYRKDSFLALDFMELEKKFGKWGDRPIMIEGMGGGNAIVFTDSYVFTGRHEAQDTHQKSTQPPHTLWLNREKYFRDILGDDCSKYPGLCFCIMNHRRIKSGYKRRIATGIEFRKYLADAFKMGAVTKNRGDALGWLRALCRAFLTHAQPTT